MLQTAIKQLGTLKGDVFSVASFDVSECLIIDVNYASSTTTVVL